MLRWLIGLLVLANVVVFVIAQGSVSPLPAASTREPQHLERQLHPELVRVRPIGPEESADQAVVGGPTPTPTVQAAPITQ